MAEFLSEVRSLARAGDTPCAGDKAGTVHLPFADFRSCLKSKKGRTKAMSEPSSLCLPEVSLAVSQEQKELLCGNDRAALSQTLKHWPLDAKRSSS